MYHEHPFKIFRHAIKNVWLLIFPVLRGLRSFTLDIETFYTWLRGAWFDLIIIAVIIGFGWFRWLFTWYRFDRHHIRLMTGVFIKTVTAVPYDNISTITAEHSFYLRPVNAVRVSIDTCAGVFGTADMKLLLRRGHLKNFHKMIPRLKMKEGRTYEFHPRIRSVIFFSFIFSSSLSGVIYLATLIFQGGRIINDMMNKSIPDMYRIVDDVSKDVSEKTPIEVPTVVTVMLLLLLGSWLLSFVSNILRYSGFTMKKGRDMLKLVSGAFTKRVYHIMPEKINYLDIRQNFLMKIFRAASIHINCSGYGRSKYELPVLLPILTREQADRSLDVLGFGKYVTEREIRPEKLAAWSYISIPTFFVIAVPTAAHLIRHFFPRLEDILIFAVIMAEIPLFWLITVKIAAFLTTGITMEDGFCCIRYSRFFAFHTLLVDKSKIVKIQLFQDVIDERINRCRVDLYFSSESTKVNKIKGLNINDAKKLVEYFGFREEEGSEKMFERAGYGER